MKNTRWIVLAALVAATAGSPVSTLTAQAKSANVMKSETNQTVSLDGERIVVGGQTYTLSGSADVRSSVEQKNGTTRIRFHYDPKGAHLTAPDGAVYKFSGAANTFERVGAKGGKFTSVAKFRLVGQGKGNKMRLHVTLHGTVDANGQVTYEKSSYDLV